VRGADRCRQRLRALGTLEQRFSQRRSRIRVVSTRWRSRCFDDQRKGASMMRVADCMTRPATGIAVTAPVRLAEEMMAQHGLSHLLVFDDRRLVGVLCACDLRAAPNEAAVRGFMLSPLMVVLLTVIVETATTI